MSKGLVMKKKSGMCIIEHKIHRNTAYTSDSETLKQAI